MTQFFLTTPQVPASLCWREAFPGGLLVDMPSLTKRMAAYDAAPGIAWISTADARWPELVRMTRSVAPQLRVVLLSGVPDDEECLQALALGVQGYSHAYAVPNLLREVATVVSHGGLWVGADLLQRLVRSTHQALALLADPAPQPRSSGDGGLTERESQVAHAVAEGRSNKEVAALLAISERTVKAHLGAVFEKLDVRDRLQLVLRLSLHNAALTAETID